MKYLETVYTNRTGILKFPDHYVCLAVMLDGTYVEENEEGKKIMPAGTIVGGMTNFLLTESTGMIASNDAYAQGVLLYDVDLTYGDAPGAVILHGFVDKNALPAAPQDAAIEALKNRIFFVD